MTSFILSRLNYGGEITVAHSVATSYIMHKHLRVSAPSMHCVIRGSWELINESLSVFLIPSLSLSLSLAMRPHSLDTNI